MRDLAFVRPESGIGGGRAAQPGSLSRSEGGEKRATAGGICGGCISKKKRGRGGRSMGGKGERMGDKGRKSIVWHGEEEEQSNFPVYKARWRNEWGWHQTVWDVSSWSG